MSAAASAIRAEHLGCGSYGSVFKALWNPPAGRKRALHPKPVAVKLLKSTSRETFKELCKAGRAELEIVCRAQREVFDKELICEAYGIAIGKLPLQLSRAFNFTPIEESNEHVGIVMRYEGGESLEHILKESDRGTLVLRPPLTLPEKFKLCYDICRGL